MHSQQDFANCAARISEEGRLLWVLGRSLTRVVENPDGLSSWAIQRLRELHENPLKRWYGRPEDRSSVSCQLNLHEGAS